MDDVMQRINARAATKAFVCPKNLKPISRVLERIMLDPSADKLKHMIDIVRYR